MRLTKLITWEEWHEFEPTPLSEQQKNAYPTSPAVGMTCNAAMDFCKVRGGRLPTYTELANTTPSVTVWEWTNDGDDRNRIVRGGSWYNDHDDATCASRFYNLPLYRDYDFGFRCAFDDENSTTIKS